VDFRVSEAGDAAVIIVVSGWRFWEDPAFVYAHLRRQVDLFGPFHLRVGNCKSGADLFARMWAVKNPAAVLTWTMSRADWSVGKPGGPIRNGQMLRGEANGEDPHPGVVADRLLAFPEPRCLWLSRGSGTVGCIRDAAFIGVDLDVPGYRGRG
jgi:hypothetical protein